ncbi:MAG: DUF4440 domain-containing protein [Anaerolinea sp.]|nr:DUF4440 domain-containing protein [Anaerolinea sp.]
MHPEDEAQVIALYHAILDAWDCRSAKDFAACFSDRGSIVGFDGSQVDGLREIAGHLAPIFADHPTPAYVSKIREVRALATGAAMLRAVVGMVPAGHTDINAALNSIQTLIATKQAGSWQAEMLQTTPAAFHGRPEAVEELTAELRGGTAGVVMTRRHGSRPPLRPQPRAPS